MERRAVDRYAALLCTHSLDLKPRQRLLIDAPPAGAPLALAVAREAWRRGADPALRMELPSMRERLLRVGSEDQLEFVGPIDPEIVERHDCVLFVEAETNTRSLST